MPACKRAAVLGAVPRKPTQFHQADPQRTSRSAKSDNKISRNRTLAGVGQLSHSQLRLIAGLLQNSYRLFLEDSGRPGNFGITLLARNKAFRVW